MSPGGGGRVRQQSVPADSSEISTATTTKTPSVRKGSLGKESTAPAAGQKKKLREKVKSQIVRLSLLCDLTFKKLSVEKQEVR